MLFVIYSNKNDSNVPIQTLTYGPKIVYSKIGKSFFFFSFKTLELVSFFNFELLNLNVIINMLKYELKL